MSGTESSGAATPVVEAIDDSDDNGLMDTDDLRDTEDEDSLENCRDIDSRSAGEPVTARSNESSDGVTSHAA